MINTVTMPCFDTEQIQKGTIIWAKHTSWNEGITGIVSDITENKITIIFLRTITNTQNHFFVNLKEVLNNEWQFRYSVDGLVTVMNYPQQPAAQGG